MKPPRAKCRDCGRCLCPKHHPEPCEKINRGRRFFMVGALALPVARKVTLAAPKIIAPPLPTLPAGLNWNDLALAVGMAGFIGAALAWRRPQGDGEIVTASAGGGDGLVVAP